MTYSLVPHYYYKFDRSYGGYEEGDQIEFINYGSFYRDKYDIVLYLELRKLNDTASHQFRYSTDGQLENFCGNISPVIPSIVLQSDHSIQNLWKDLYSRFDDVREGAARDIAALSVKSVPVSLDLLKLAITNTKANIRSEDNIFVQVLVAHKKDYTPYIAEQISQLEVYIPSHRNNLHVVLCLLGSQVYYDDYIRNLESDEPHVVRSALEFLCLLKNPHSLVYIEKLLTHKNGSVRLKASMAVDAFKE